MPDLGYRPMGLESDLNNQNFTGAVNPDSLLHCEFYWHTPLDRNKTDENFEETGKLTRIYGEKRPYVRIQKPGDPNSIIETPVREDHKRRFPEKWLYFQIQENLIDAGQNAPGWKIETWEELSPDEIHKLKFLRFYTVEQIAGASDAQIMGVGMGGLGLRKRAQEALANRQCVEVRNALQAKDKELQDMKERMAKLEAMLMPPPNAAPPATDPTPPPSLPEVQPEAAATPVKKTWKTMNREERRAYQESKKGT